MSGQPPLANRCKLDSVAAKKYGETHEQDQQEPMRDQVPV